MHDARQYFTVIPRTFLHNIMCKGFTRTRVRKGINKKLLAIRWQFVRKQIAAYWYFCDGEEPEKLVRRLSLHLTTILQLYARFTFMVAAAQEKYDRLYRSSIDQKIDGRSSCC